MEKAKFFISTFIEKNCSTKRIISIILVLFVFTFHIYLLEKYNSLIVTPILSTFDDSVVTSTALIISGICTILFFIYWFRKKVLIDFSTFIFSLVFFVIYCFFRFFTEEYTFAPIETSIKYSDYLLLVSTGIISLKMRELFLHVPHPIYLENSFLIDQPIQHSNSDLLGRKRFAEKLSESIQSKSVQENIGSLAIGILGSWGSGKTSFVNMVLQDLLQKDRLVIRFNPWLNSSPEQIINDFFNLLTSELSKYDSTISLQINNYAKTILESNSSKILSNLFSLSENLSKKNLYERVNANLNNIKKQVVVFIDDLDRLDKKEIIEVLRIVRNTGNFSNITYIVAYDKKYVQEAIKVYNTHNHSYFLEKIFQFEFELPVYEFRETRQFLQLNLYKKLDPKFHSQIDFILNKKNKAYELTSKIILTHRDAIRFINSFCFEFNEIMNDVYLYDFYLIHLLKLKYNFFSQDLIEKWNIFFITDYQDRKRSYLRLRKTSEKNIQDNNYEYMMFWGFNDSKAQKSSLPDPFIIFDYLTENQTHNNISKYEVIIIQELIQELLDLQKEVPDSKNENYKMLAYPKNFYKYFSLQLLYNEIPSYEFDNVRIGKFDIYQQKLEEWINENILSLVDKIFSVKDFNSKNEFENHIKALFKLGSYLMEDNKTNLFDFAYLSSNFKQNHKNEIYNTGGI